MAQLSLTHINIRVFAVRRFRGKRRQTGIYAYNAPTIHF
jgi:hypothetical protein